ncbi:hypothetical protein RKS58_15450 [Lysinibacillus capsici]|uniref:hypothetical protein n=1 Tax=Lysinibacillus capsici TaxID=2115968 RepID=UPI0028BE7414|nr:hypothetical protein [Lysinibacillus capsici]WNN74780.1 hypothetical protein RKS58_15450 [Lysinibacillus capsici]
MVPVVGEVADGVNGIIYVARGDKVNAALSFGAMIPVVGNAATAGKWVNKGAKAAKGISESAQKANKGLLGNVKEKVNKQVSNVKTQIQAKVDEVKQQLRQLRPPEMELAGAGVNVRRIEDTGTVGKNTSSSSPKPSNSQPPQNSSNKKPAENKDASQIGTSPRYGDRQISDEEYDMLRGQTPTQKLRDKINEGHDKKTVTKDQVLPGKTFKGALEADHIVSMDRIARMDGFGNLTNSQKLDILNDSENFVGLSKSANTSKQSKSYEEWTHYKKGKPGEIEVNPEFREKMIVKEKELERKIQKQIDDFNELNKKGDD